MTEIATPEKLADELRNDPEKFAQLYVADPTVMLQELLESLHRYERACVGAPLDEREHEAWLTLAVMISIRDSAIKETVGLLF